MPQRNKNKEFVFSDYPDFRPNMSPKEIFTEGAFGGTYWRAIDSHVTGKHHQNVHRRRYPASWWNKIPDTWLTTPWNEYDKTINKYDVKVGTTLEFWEDSGWIVASHPYGWVHWYCDFFSGKRCPDDARQVDRWKKTAGPHSRFRVRLINMIHDKHTDYDDYDVSPAIRQTLLHWAYELTAKDYNKKK